MPWTRRRAVGADSRLARFMLHNQKPLKTPQLAAQTQLYLGDVHPKLEDRASYRPTAYQPPLSRQHEVPSFIDFVVIELFNQLTE